MREYQLGFADAIIRQIVHMAWNWLKQKKERWNYYLIDTLVLNVDLHRNAGALLLEAQKVIPILTVFWNHSALLQSPTFSHDVHCDKIRGVSRWVLERLDLGRVSKKWKKKFSPTCRQSIEKRTTFFPSDPLFPHTVFSIYLTWACSISRILSPRQDLNTEQVLNRMLV